MKQTRTLTELEEFAKERGRKIEDGILIFEKDSEAAQKFYTEASAASNTRPIAGRLEQ
jgi:hypothetical protein